MTLYGKKLNNFGSFCATKSLLKFEKDSKEINKTKKKDF